MFSLNTTEGQAPFEVEKRPMVLASCVVLLFWAKVCVYIFDTRGVKRGGKRGDKRGILRWRRASLFPEALCVRGDLDLS